MNTEENNSNKDTLDKALRGIKENDHQDLSKEQLGNEDEFKTEESDNPYKLKGLEDKRPEDPNIEKGWTIDSNTSRGPDELKDKP
jgi:hypothetical protein